MNLTLFYTCDLCGLNKVMLDVPVREGEENIRTWMDHVVHLVAHDHTRRSPTCPAKELTELRIPLTGDRIGGPTKQ